MTQDWQQYLLGEQVRLWPYSAGLYPPETLRQLWTVLNTTHFSHRLFWPNIGDQETITYGEFVEKMQRVILLLPEDLTTHQLMGCIWFDEILEGIRAHWNIFYAKPFRGEKAREASRLSLAYGHDVMGWKTLWGITPWRDAQRHGIQCGFEQLCIIPGYAYVQGKYLDVYVGRHTA